LGKTTVAL